MNPDDLSPGIRDLVLFLRSHGFDTTDSGDGSNYAAGMCCALPFRHVFIYVDPEHDTGVELARLKAVMGLFPAGREYEVGMFDPMPGHPDFLCVQDANWQAIEDAALEENQ